jgi:hypothetical protein
MKSRIGTKGTGCKPWNNKTHHMRETAALQHANQIGSDRSCSMLVLGSTGTSALTVGLFDPYKYVRNIGMPCVEVNAMLERVRTSH